MVINQLSSKSPWKSLVIFWFQGHQPFRWPNQPASLGLQESVEGPALWRDLAGGLAGDGEGYHGSDSFDAELRAVSSELLKIGG